MTAGGKHQKFDAAMFGIYHRAKTEARYNATIFLSMLSDRGGVETAKFLINSQKESDGFAALFLAGRLDLTVEAMLIEHPKWHVLFEEHEIERAKARLVSFKYESKAPKTSRETL